MFGPTYYYFSDISWGKGFQVGLKTIIFIEIHGIDIVK